MNTRYQHRTPRAALLALALAMTVALANFVDFLATDYAVGLRQTARLPATTIVTALQAPSR
jgi:hypothetical protein